MGAIVRERARQQPDRRIVRFAERGRDLRGARRSQRPLRRSPLGRGVRARRPRGGAAAERGDLPRHLDRRMAKAGLVEVPLHTSLRGDPLRHALKVAGCRMAVVEAPLVERVLAAAEGLPGLSSRGRRRRAPARRRHRGLRRVRSVRPLAGAAGRRQHVRPLGDPLHLGHDRTLEGRGAHALRELPPTRAHRRGAAGVRATCSSPRSRCSTSPPGTSRRSGRHAHRRGGGDPPDVLRQPLLGGLRGRGGGRDPLPGSLLTILLKQPEKPGDRDHAVHTPMAPARRCRSPRPSRPASASSSSSCRA